MFGYGGRQLATKKKKRKKRAKGTPKHSYAKWAQLRADRDYFKARAGIEKDERWLITHKLFPLLRDLLTAFAAGDERKVNQELVGLKTMAAVIGVWDDGPNRESLRNVTMYREAREAAKKEWRRTGLKKEEREALIAESRATQKPAEVYGSFVADEVVGEEQNQWQKL